MEAIDAVTAHIVAIKDIADGMRDPVDGHALQMMAAHNILELPHDDVLAYEALEKVYLHFHTMEGKDNGTN